MIVDSLRKTEDEITKLALAEHQAVRRMQQEIHAFLEEGVFGSEETWREKCLELFDGFFNHLREHFAVEETGGFMKPALEVRPTLHPQIEKLKAEHVQMLETGHVVLARLQGQGHSDLTLEDVRTHILKLLEVLREHERTENRMLVTAFDIDLGPGD
jgi:hypothetical protein